MDDLLMNALIAQMARQIIIQRVAEELARTICDICNERDPTTTLTKCVFCDKDFCPNCCGKRGTSICKVCNFGLAQAVDFRALNMFSVRELKVISTNYKISLDGVLEKTDLIQSILREFQKSIEGCRKPTVDVEDLRQKMLNMQIEECNFKEEQLLKEREGMIKCANYDCIKKDKRELAINFMPDDHLNVSSTEDIPKMSVKEIKNILESFNVDYSHAIEKTELVDLAIHLTETYNEFRAKNQPVTVQNEDSPNENQRKLECVICMDQKISCVFLNCAHSNCCYECGQEIHQCPICRAPIENCLKIFIG